MAPVLARLVRSLAALALVAGVAIVIHGCVWATLCFTEVRSHGFDAVTNPERVGAGGEASGNSDVTGSSAVAVRATSAPSVARPESEDVQSPAEPRQPTPASSAERFLGFLTGLSTIGGVAALALLPIVLVVAFITALVRAPRAANASMAGILWALLAFAVVLPWSAFWPQVPWSGLFVSYESLVAETEALRATGNPFSFGAFLAHVVVPGGVIAILVGLAWRCGEPLHAELMAAESLLVDPEVEKDAAAVARQGPTVARSRSAAGLAAATNGPQGVIVSAVSADEANTPDDRPRRLI